MGNTGKYCYLYLQTFNRKLVNDVYIFIQLVTQNKGNWLAISLGSLVFSAHHDVSVEIMIDETHLEAEMKA